MKKILFLLVIGTGLFACKSTDKKTETPSVNLTPEQIEKAKNDTANFTTIEWTKSTVDLGKLKKDQEVEVTFEFKNTGDKVLVIENVSASCGCTIPEKPNEPFAPGQSGLIKAKFNGSGSGAITKNVTVIANTKPAKDHSLTFTGTVE